MSEDHIGQYMAVVEGMEKRRVGDQAKRVIHALMKLSFLASRTDAPVARLDELAEATMIHRGNLRRVIDGLIAAEVIDEQTHGAFLAYEVRPDWVAWKLPWRHRPDEEARAERVLGRMVAVAHHDPAQMRLIETEQDVANDVSRAFAPPVVRGTTGAPSIAPPVVRRTTETPASGAVVPCTTDVNCDTLGTVPSVVVRGTTDPYSFKGDRSYKGFKAPTSLPCAEAGAKGAAVEQVRKPDPDADIALLIERMWQVIPSQRTEFAGAWINRAKAVPRAMRLAVDKWHEMGDAQRVQKRSRWQWLRAEYIGTAHKLGLEDKLLPHDQERRGWWTKAREAARPPQFSGA